MKKLFLFLALFLMQTNWVYAQHDAPSKLGRGLSNTAFGWFEIFNELGEEMDRRGPLGVPTGLVRGAVLGVGRTLVGVLEVISFPFPNGKGDYEPIMQPESVFARR